MNDVIKVALACALVALAGCETTPVHTTVTTAPGMAAGKLDTAKDEQITALKERGALLEARSIAAEKLAASAAGNVHGILAAAEHVSEPKDAAAKEAVMAEANLAKPKLPAALPADLLEAERRVNLLITGQRDEAKRAYGAALAEVGAMKAAVAAADAELSRYKSTIAKRDQEIVRLAGDAQRERTVAAKQLQTAINAKEKAEQAMRDHETSLVVKACIGIGAMFVAVSLAAAVFFIWSGAVNAKNLGACGAGLAAGAIAFALSRFLAHPWLPWAAGGAIVLIVGIVALLIAKDYFDAKKTGKVAVAESNKLVTSVATFMSDLRKSDLPGDMVEKVVTLIDAATDTKHQDAIRLVQAKGTP